MAVPRSVALDGAHDAGRARGSCSSNALDSAALQAGMCVYICVWGGGGGEGVVDDCCCISSGSGGGG